jgi:hypothetical protein
MATTPHLINARQFVEGIKRPGFQAFTRLPDALGTAGLPTDCTELAALINTDYSIYSQLGAVLGVLESALSDCSKQITALNAQCLAEQNRAKDLQDLANTLSNALQRTRRSSPGQRKTSPSVSRAMSIGDRRLLPASSLIVPYSTRNSGG